MARMVKAKIRAFGLSTKRDISIAIMIRAVMPMIPRSSRVRFSFQSVLEAPRFTAIAPTTPTA